MFSEDSYNLLKNDILEYIKVTEEGISVHQLLSNLNIKTSKRNIQRHLTDLVEEKKIYRTGKGPSTQYHALNLNRMAESYIDGLPLNEASKKVFDLVTRPLSIRTPVSYRRDMLDGYIPNKTEYLNQTTRDRLYQIGKTSNQTRAAGTYGREILNRLLIDLSWASSKLEGNTYSRLDTKRLIEYGQIIEGKDFTETQMILNHKDAIRFLIENIEQININRRTILNLHGLLSDSLLPNPEDTGRLRTTIVNISGTTYIPLSIPQVIEECFDIILKKSQEITDPFEQAFFLMVHMPYLQPFIDVNKRVARLSLNIPLLKNNLCPLTFIDMPEQAYVQGMLGIYELNDISLLREVFIFAYERSTQEYLAVHQSLVEPDPLRIKYRKAIQELINLIVKSCDQNIENTIDDYAKKYIAETEQFLFKQFILADLKRLHEGVLARYRLSETDFDKWIASRG